MDLRQAPRIFGLLLVAVVMAAIALNGGSAPRAVEAAGATLFLPNASCSGTSATVTFVWTPPPGATETWLDLSTRDNGFINGSFRNAGPLAGNETTYTWSGLETLTPYFWRIDSRMANGWVASETGVFVVCSAPILLASNPECSGNAGAAVTFQWAPSIPAAREQWIDVSTQGTFEAGTFNSHGPLSAAANLSRLDRLPSNGYAYRIVGQLQDGSWRSSIVRTFVVDCGAGADIDLHHTGDTLVYQNLGIAAKVNVRKIAANGGALLNPEGKDDVVRYDFSSVPGGLGGYPGNGGTTVLAGHLDYRPYYQASFYHLTKAKQGDIIEYRRADGVVKKYVVSWAGSIPFNQSLNEYLVATKPESMLLITCEGSFDESAGGYDRRAIVYAVTANF